MPEKTPQPPDEFDGALGEPLEACNDEGHFAAGFLHAFRALCQDFFPALFLRHVADAGFGESGFKVDHQVTDRNGPQFDDCPIIVFPYITLLWHPGAHETGRPQFL